MEGKDLDRHAEFKAQEQALRSRIVELEAKQKSEGLSPEETVELANAHDSINSLDYA